MNSSMRTVRVIRLVLLLGLVALLLLALFTRGPLQLALLFSAAGTGVMWVTSFIVTTVMVRKQLRDLRARDHATDGPVN